MRSVLRAINSPDYIDTYVERGHAEPEALVRGPLSYALRELRVVSQRTLKDVSCEQDADGTLVGRRDHV